MSLHHLIRSCVHSPRSSSFYISHQRPVVNYLFSKTFIHNNHNKTCGQQYPQQADLSRICFGRSNSDLLTCKSQQLLTLPFMANSQPSLKFSSSAFYCNSNLDDKRGNVTSSKQSLFDFFSLRSLISTPAPYMLYGIGGLIPFMSVPFYIHMTSTYSPLLAHAQLVYGACILSFLGGVAWGNELNMPAMSDFKSLGYSISLPLIGWVSVLAYPNLTAFPILISGIVIAGCVDTKMQLYPKRFKNLRFLLSTLVSISLMSTFAFRLMYSTSEKES